MKDRDAPFALRNRPRRSWRRRLFRPRSNEHRFSPKALCSSAASSTTAQVSPLSAWQIALWQPGPKRNRDLHQHQCPGDASADRALLGAQIHSSHGGAIRFQRCHPVLQDVHGAPLPAMARRDPFISEHRGGNVRRSCLESAGDFRPQSCARQGILA